MPEATPSLATPTGDRTTARRAQTLLIKLGRAVQRVSIYPPGHPAASAGVGPLVDALLELVADGPASLAIGRTRVIVSCQDEPPSEHESPWIAGRLFDRGVSAIALDGDIDAEEVARFVMWLAGPGDDKQPLPDFSGLRLARFDGTRVRFRDERATGDADASTNAAWRALTAALNVDPGADDAIVDPEKLAEQLRLAIATTEGTGVSELARKLVEGYAGADGADGQDDEARLTLAKNLAVLIERLQPELSGSLLTLGPSSSPQQVALVEDVLEHLSMPVLQHIIEHVRVDAVATDGPFSGFLRKLARVSMADPSLGEALDRRLSPAAQVPAALVFDHDPSRIAPRPATPRAPDEFVPTAYRERLDALIAAEQDAADVGTSDPETGGLNVALHLVSLAHHEAGRNPVAPEALPYLRTLLDLAPELLGASRFDLLATSTELMQRAAAEVAPSVALAQVLEGFSAFLQETATVTAVVAETASRTAGSDDPIVRLLSAGGEKVVRRVIERFKTLGDGVQRDRLMMALSAIDPAVFRSVIFAEVPGNRKLAEALAHVLGCIEPARAIEMAFQLLGTRHTDARRRAVEWLLSTPLSSAKRMRVFQRALDDDDTRIITLAIDAAHRHPSVALVDPLTAFIERRTSDELAPLQARAVQVLAASGPEAVARLTRTLEARRFAWSAHSRRLGVTVASALKASKDAQAQAAARARRLSAAGVLSWLTHTRGVQG